MPRRQLHQHQAAPAGGDQLRPHHFVGLVIRALDEHIRRKLFDQRHRRIFLEDGDEVHAAQRRQHLRPRGGRLQRPARALQALHGGVAVQPHDQAIALLRRPAQQGHMTRMQEIETAISEADR